MTSLDQFSAQSLSAVLAELDLADQRDRLSRYKPYPRQMEFHRAGERYRERTFLAGNQLGKTIAGGAELAMHLTGRYPSWWRGRRWDRPIIAWAAGITGESTRDNPQRMLLGRAGEGGAGLYDGTGMIPAETISTVSRALGVSNLADGVRVKHASGGTSALAFKFYEKGREKWQGETLDLVWFDEEPPEDIYAEGLTRTNATGGMVYITATPLLGMTRVVKMFYPTPTTPDRCLIKATIEDAEHYTAEQRARIIAAYPAHERDARARGIPKLGEGAIFPVAEDAIKVRAFPIPDYWPQIGGLDFGYDHPFAAVRLAWDADPDIVYVTQTHRVREQTPVLHAAAIKPWGEWLPWAWPHDGRQHGKDGSMRLADQYRAQKLRLLPEFAPIALEAGIMMMLDRMQTGRLKVFAHLEDWFDEMRVYHRDDGKVVAENDDLMSATRYALLCIKQARVPPELRRLRTGLVADGVESLYG